MFSFSPEVSVAVAAIMAAIAALMAAIAAWKANSTAKNMLKHEKFREQNRILFYKRQFEVEHLQKLISSFSRVIFLASLELGDARNRILDEAIQEMQFHVLALESLNISISADITRWIREKNSDGEGIPQNIYHELGELHAITGDKHKKFMQSKMEGLKKIQDKMFSEMA